MRLVVTRPWDDAQKSAASLRALDHQSILCPLTVFEGQARHVFAPAGDFKNIILTSSNAVRALADANLSEGFFAKSAWCVGSKTREEAKSFGLGVTPEFWPDVRALVEALRETIAAQPDQTWLYCRGQTISFDLASAFPDHVRDWTIYDMVVDPTQTARLATLAREKSFDGILFYSKRTAKIASDALSGLPLSQSRAFCLSPAIAAEIASLGFVEILTAKEKTEESLLRLVSEVS